MTDQQYQRLKRFLGFFYDWYMTGPHSRPSSHPLVIAEICEKKAPAKAKQGLLMAINDVIEMSIDWNPKRVVEADRRFIENGAPSLSEIRMAYSKQYKRILKRGRIISPAEYYLLKGIIDGNVVEMDANEREKLDLLLRSCKGQ